MIKISVNANRSDIAGYISYYSSKEIAPLLNIDEKEIIYEASVIDYFAFGDVDFNTKVETVVTISDNYADYMNEIAEILAKYLSGFVPEFDIRYEIINSNLIYSYKVEGRKEDLENECHCHEEGHECHCHEEGHECHCHEEGHECHCHEEGHECHCHEEGHECHCHEEGHECKCGDTCEK